LLPMSPERLVRVLPMSPERLVRVDPNAKRQPRNNRAPVFGFAVEITGQKTFKVCFNNGHEKEISSNQLKSHRQAASLPPEDTRLIIEQGVSGGDDVYASLEHLKALASEAAADLRDGTQEEEDLPLENKVVAYLLQLDGVEEERGGLDDAMHEDDHEAVVDNAEDLMLSQEMLSQGRIPDVAPPDCVAAEEFLFAAHTDYVYASDDKEDSDVRYMPSLDDGEIAPASAAASAPAPAAASPERVLTSGQLTSLQEEENYIYVHNASHQQRLVNARDKIQNMIGQKVTIEQGKASARKKY
jgi:hypothetical protein